MELFSEEYLAHHGVQGQKWGVRRYQNPDGSLTDKGRKRIAKLNKKVDKETRRIDNKYANQVIKYVDDPSVKNARKYIKVANKYMYNVKLSEIKKSEIEKGFNYYERNYRNSVSAANYFGGLPAAVAVGNSVNKKYKEGVSARKDLTRAYKDRAFNYDDKNSSFNKYTGKGKNTKSPSLVWYDSDPIIKREYERQLRNRR